MKTRYQKLPFLSMDTLTEKLFTESSIFFDIETTGFSPKHTQLYLIGCARREGNMLCLEQFFAESLADEKQILNAFLELLLPYDTIITYNGLGFDIPYLKAKCEQLELTENFSHFTYVDIFKTISGLKHILKLENYKQKSIEQFLHIARNDRYSGGELVPVYRSYVKSFDETLLQLLFEHNYEDVLGMMNIIPILSYAHLFRGNIQSVTDLRLDTAKAYDGTTVNELTMTFTPEYLLPERISYRKDDLYLSGGKEKISLVIRLFEGELKYFYPNYKDYYYLPEEDTAIHKSVASYVDKEHREPAKAVTCYTKKSGLFLPQYDNIVTPAFFKNYGDKISYFPYTQNFDADATRLVDYASHLLRILGNGKTTK